MDTDTRNAEIVDTLLAKRYLLLQGEITSKHQEKLSQFIFYLNAIDHTLITLLIDSGGGAKKSGLMICDAIKLSTAPIDALVIGAAYSASFRILQSCRKRIAYPNAKFMFHGSSFSGSRRIDEEDFETELNELRTSHEEQLRLISKRSGQPIKELRKWSKQEHYFTAEEAKKFGFIDEIVEQKEQ